MFCSTSIYSSTAFCEHEHPEAYILPQNLHLHLPLSLHLVQHLFRNPKRLHPGRHATISTVYFISSVIPVSFPTFYQIQAKRDSHPISIPRSRNQKPRTHLACNNASLISTSVHPFLTAPLTCVPNSTHFPSAVSMTRFSRLLVLSSSPGRVHIVPHAISYI